jgi:hypothetical protein
LAKRAVIGACALVGMNAETTRAAAEAAGAAGPGPATEQGPIEVRGKVRIYTIQMQLDPQCPGCALPDLTVSDITRMCKEEHAYKVPKELLDEIIALIEQLSANSRYGGYESVADGHTLYAWDRGQALVRDDCAVIQYINAAGEVVEWAVVAEE